MSKDTAPLFRSITGFQHLPTERRGSEPEAIANPAPSPCLALAFLLSIPLWAAIWAAVFAAASAWASWSLG
jgi:hypothetical protein